METGRVWGPGAQEQRRTALILLAWARGHFTGEATLRTGGLQGRVRVDRLSRQREQLVQNSEACLGCDG